MGGDSDSNNKLGRIMLVQKLITEADLEEVIAALQRNPDSRIASQIVQSGKLDESQVLAVLSEQRGVPAIDLKRVVIPLTALSLIPFDVAKQFNVLPLNAEEERLSIAMSDPQEQRVVDEIEFVTGKHLFPFVALESALIEVIDQAYSMADQGEAFFIGPKVTEEELKALGLDDKEQIATQGLNFDTVNWFSEKGQHQQETPATVTAENQITDQLDSAFDEKIDIVETDTTQVNFRKTPQILVVDDEDDIRNMLRRVLEKSGYEVMEAESGLKALSAVREQMPNLILLDAMLPGVHGFDICRRLKGSKRYGHIPIIMLSAIYRGWRFAEDLKQSYGIQYFFEKPFKLDELMSVVKRLLIGQDEGAISASEQVSSDAKSILNQSLAAFQSGDLDGAIAYLEQGVANDPLTFRLHYHLGLLYGRRKEIFKAIECLEKAISLQSDHFGALKNLAILYFRAGFRHKSIEMWERALSNSPDLETRKGIKEYLVTLL